MKVLANGACLSLFALLLHLAWWRIRLPRRQMRRLLYIQTGSFLAWLTCSLVAGSGGRHLMQGLAMDGAERLHVFVFYWSVMLAYDVLYSALDVDSPTMVMMRMIDEAGEEGVDKERFFAQLGDDVLIRPRVQDLLRDRFALLLDGRYHLTGKGRVMAFIFSTYRKILGRPVLGG